MLLLGFWAREEQESKALMQRPRYSKALPRGPVRAALSLQFLYQRNGKEAHGRELTKCLLLHTNLTCEQLAMVLVGKPMDGAQATSRTQSLWASSFCSSFHWPSSSLKTQLHSQKGSSSILHHLSHALLRKAFDCTIQTPCSSTQYKPQVFLTSPKTSMAWTDKIPSRGQKAQAKRFWPSVTVRNLQLPKW